MSTWVEASKVEWHYAGKPDRDLRPEDLQTGCLQRIAKATEVMAANWQSLTTERDRYKKWYEEEREKRHRIERRATALRGVITRLKRAQIAESRKG